MSVATASRPTQDGPGADPRPAAAELDWGQVGRQVLGILRLEIGKNLVSQRALALYFLAFAPVVLVGFWAAFPVGHEQFGGPAGGASIFANLFPFYLRGAVFLSALFLFTSLYRTEILEKSLHYYLLTPVRREVLTAGKYLAALVAMTATFVVATTLMFLFFGMPWGFGELVGYLFRGAGLGNLIAYLGIVILGCAGYGAVFLLAGLFFRNPIVPGAVFLAWEVANFLLPPLLKKVSVIHYLKSLYPIPVREGPFAIVAEPTPAWISVPGVILFTLLVLAVAGWRARTMEITYGGE